MFWPFIIVIKVSGTTSFINIVLNGCGLRGCLIKYICCGGRFRRCYSEDIFVISKSTESRTFFGVFGVFGIYRVAFGVRTRTFEIKPGPIKVALRQGIAAIGMLPIGIAAINTIFAIIHIRKWLFIVRCHVPRKLILTVLLEPGVLVTV